MERLYSAYIWIVIFLLFFLHLLLLDINKKYIYTFFLHFLHLFFYIFYIIELYREF